MRIKFSKLCLLTGIGMMCFSTQSFASNCSLAPDCASLGYTKSSSDCNGLDTIKCPFNTSKVFCLGEADKEEQGTSAGQILYGDGTVSTTIVSGKKPIGVVFDMANRLAIALKDVKDSVNNRWSMFWSSENCDVPNLDNCDNNQEKPLTCGTDGRANTTAILAVNGGCAGTTYAANAANAYQTSNCAASFCQQGKWFLPSFKELDTIYSNKAVINNSLTLLESQGAETLYDDFYWSSTEYSYQHSFRLSFSNGFWSMPNKSDYGHMYRVRPAIKF